MSMPAIVNAEPATVKRILEELGFLPFVQCKLADLRETVLRLRSDPQFYSDGVERGRQAIREAHGSAIVAARALAYYEQAFEMKALPLPEATKEEMRQPVPIPAVRAVKKTRPKAAGEIGEQGLVLIRYIGGNQGGTLITGAVTGARYEFSAKGQRYMDVRDADALLGWDQGTKRKSGNKRGKRNFEVVNR